MHCVQNLTSCAPRKSLGAPLCVWLKVRGEGGLFPNSSAFLLSKFACVDGLSDMMMIALAPHNRTRTKSVPLSPSPHSTKPLLAVLRTKRCRGSPSGCAANEVCSSAVLPEVSLGFSSCKHVRSRRQERFKMLQPDSRGSAPRNGPDPPETRLDLSALRSQTVEPRPRFANRHQNMAVFSFQTRPFERLCEMLIGRVLVAGLVLLLASLAVITHVSGQRRAGVSLLSRPVRARQMMLRGELPVLPSTSPSPLLIASTILPSTYLSSRD